MKRTMSLIVILAALALAVTGCETLFTGDRPSHRRVSSLVQYLYPSTSDHVDKPTTPVLTLPLRVGVAFVPDEGASGGNLSRTPPLSEQQKVKLLNQVSEEFRKYPFVKSIQVIPSIYLQPRGGFENVEQLRSMFGVDVISLVSYDQIQFTGENMGSLAYITIVGAYLVPGHTHQTRTMVDAAVYDIASRKLLFRAPGLSVASDTAIAINANRELRRESHEGFSQAATNLITNLEQELAAFRTRIKESPEEVKIVRSPGYVGGAGAIGFTEVLLLGALALGGWCARRFC
jgi:rhombotail lipoprotein